MKLVSKMALLAFIGCMTCVHADSSKYNRIIKENKQIKSIQEEITKEQQSKSAKDSKIRKLEKKIERCKTKINDMVKSESRKIEIRLKNLEKRREQYVKSGKSTEKTDTDIAECQKEMTILQAVAGGKSLKEAEAEAETAKAKTAESPAKDEAKGDKKTDKTKDKSKDKSKDNSKENSNDGGGEDM